jgi:hypothetical protein
LLVDRWSRFTSASFLLKRGVRWSERPSHA